MLCMKTLTCAQPAPPALKSRMWKASAWLLGGNISAQALRLTSNLILTRLLVPEAFGLMAAVSTLYFALIMFSDLGVWQSIVRSERGTEPQFLGTAWMVQIFRGALIAILVVLAAAGLQATSDSFSRDSAYADPRLPHMLLLFALCALVQGFESMKLALAERELQTGRIARLELISQLTGMTVTIAVAYQTRSVWALLAGTVAGCLVKTLLSHALLQGPFIKPAWDKHSATEILGFGKWIFASSIIGFLAAHGEKIILGASLNAAAFGLYALAGTLLAAVSGLYSTLNGRVIYASLNLAIRSGDPEEIRRVYTHVQKIADLFLGTIAGVLLVSAHWIVWVLYDSRYQQAGWMLQTISLSLLAMRHQVVEQLMFAQNRPALVSANNLLRAISLAVLIPLGFALADERGAIWGVLLAQFASWPLSLRFKLQSGLLNRATEKWWLPALGAGMACGEIVDLALSAWIH